MKKVHVHIDSINLDSFLLVHKDIPKEKQKTGKRLPFFYFWLKDHYYQRSKENFKRTSWSFSDDPLPIERNVDLIDKLSVDVPDIIGVGLYTWNIEVALKNIKTYKKINPNALIIAGGPSAEAHKDFLENNSDIDLVILGPGIEIFRRVIDCVVENKPTRDVEGVSYLERGKVVRNKSLPRQHDPLLINYVENFREELTDVIKEYQSKYNKIVFQTYFLHGCPYSCSFCEQGTSLWTKINRRPIDLLQKEIDFLVKFKNIEYEFLDQNFGIVKDYIDLVKYFISKNVDRNVYLKNPTMAKNNIDVVFEIIDLINSSGTPKAGIISYAYIALQDTNPDVLKLNGRPISREFEKIEKFKEITKHNRYKLNQVDIIIGLPGQSFDSLSVTLYDLFKNELLGQKPPNLYTVLPNTTLTADDSKIFFESGKVWHRMQRRSGLNFIDFDGVDYSDYEYGLEYLTKSATIDAMEIVSAHYMFILLAHVSWLTRWIDTPLNYIKNYHQKTDKDFVKTFTKFFKPSNRHMLPDCVKKDLDALNRWFTGKDKFLMRRDNDDKGHLVFDTMAKYRFHFNYKEMAELFTKMFIEMIGGDDVVLDGLMKWQELLTFFPDKKQTTLTSYNYDDVAVKKSDTYYLSKWKVTFDTLDRQKILRKFMNLDQIHYIPKITWEEVDPNHGQTPWKIHAKEVV